MSEASPELKVVSGNSRGRKRYDNASKRALVEACLRPGGPARLCNRRRREQ
ncbi:transposase fragment, IS3 family [Cupriavidus phytorum]|uniref:Transposase, IS3 family n=3 Tax=Cupriavidus TaxID=106589 RepID=B2AJD8_CUPTR|nr:transposase fragment, IS3 family [Cupriavidus taiwanensis LMG 19424]SOY78036.1 transposase fragment, IS3 family [Cupriavidus taiwanensis]SOZ40658.1 transposase fragment, IS3 family [Cupriavidus neocaledonicus]SOZ51648.1 transposase fragment, IS3 family [Cupriavidus taiwanensis]